MSTRERWVIYPLLFLTLGTVMRDKLFPQSHFRALEVTTPEITVDRVRCTQLDVSKVNCTQLDVSKLSCREMEITEPGRRKSVHLGTAPRGGGRMVLFGKGGKPAVVAGVDDSGLAGTLQTMNAGGATEVQLRSTPAGGTVTTIRRDKQVWLVLGYQGPYYGVFAESPRLGRGLSLTLPWRFPAPPAVQRPPEVQSPREPPESPGREAEK